MLRCRKSTKFLDGEKWPETFKEYSTIIKAVMSKHKCDELQAVLKLHTLDSVKNSGMMSMIIMGVCAEMLEPEK